MIRHLLFLFALCAALTACRSSKGLTKDKISAGKGTPTATTPITSFASAAAAFTARAAKVKAAKPCLTASVKVGLTGVGKGFSASGSLRMKRDDVIRLSIRVLGMEVGLMEFTPQDVLVIDRFHKQYVRAAYSEVSFLKAARLDFYSLQSLFWDELFVPGTRNASAAADRFVFSAEGGQNVLRLTDTPQLNYTFTLSPADARVRTLSVAGKTASQRGTFTWRYDDFAAYDGQPFPRSMAMEVKGTGKDLGLTLDLSNLKADSDWNTRTTVSSRYQRKTVAEVLGGLKL